jgi:hypothetical protein
MSADREWLELAAKAVGMVVLADGVEWPRENTGWFFNQVGDNPPALYDRASNTLAKWAPLTDDGDRYRLIRDLKLSVDFSDCCVWKRMPNGSLIQEYWGGECGDEAHAVLRAAAELAKAKP